MDDPAAWAKAAEAAGADLIYLTLSATLPDGQANTAANARAALRKVLDATGLPVAVVGPGQAELDNELIVAAAEEGKGERLLIGICEEKNYRTLVAAALANDHLVQSKTPMDVNLSKQLVILIHDMGLPLERIVIDPDHRRAGLRDRVRLLGDGAPAPGGAAGRQHDAAAHHRHPGRRGLEGQGSQGGRRRAGGLG